MALKTLGTTGTTVLSALNWNPMSAQVDVAAIAAGILGQSATAFHGISPGAFSNSGRLKFPGREGQVFLKPGDWVAFDSFGWPVIVSSQSIAAGGSSWAHS